MLRIAGLLAALTVPVAFAQMAISVRSGLVHHVEGQAELDGQTVKPKFGEYPMIKEGSVFATQEGRAEVLLAPGAFLRLGRDTSVRMQSSALTDTRFEVLSGTALVEIADLPKNHRIHVHLGESETALESRGLYEFDSQAARLRVFDGKAKVALRRDTETLKKGREAQLAAPVLQAEKFNVKESRDTLYAWSENRSGRIAQANIAAAGSYAQRGLRLPSYGWAFYPSWGMYTFLPNAGMFQSPFGWYWYSPGSVWQYYAPRYYDYGGGGYGRGDRGWSGIERGSIAGPRGAIGSGGGGRGAAAPSAPAVSRPSGGRGRGR